MIVLLLGSGGREHAMAWKIVQSPLVSRLFVLPGSDGIASLNKVECLPGSVTDAAAVLAVAQKVRPDLIVVGPDRPPEAGVTDALEKAGFLVAAPSKAAARLETSKIFAKEFMKAEGIPTAAFTVCNSHDEAVAALKNWDIEKKGVVIKADGLAEGKGVVVTHDRAEALKTAHDFILDPACTVKSARLLLEEKVTGKEVSAFALCDGETFVQLGYACDYKRVRDGNEGPNTGGMGCYVPEGWPSAAMRKFVEENIFKKTLAGMKRNGEPFKGFLYAGLMIDGDKVNVIEFNARMGDPETQVLFPLIEDDLVPLLEAAAKGRLSAAKPVALKKSSAVHVVMTSEGYPDTMGTGMRLGEAITLPRSINDNALLFIAGAKKNNGGWINSGGRVLGVTALGPTIEEARKNAYETIEAIHFNGAHWRKDIGR
jgi:phosphoribosylamine--glycine ligase